MKRRYIVLVILLAAVSCRQRYDPPVISSGNTFLVVEANLNPQGLTSILLTRTGPLDRGSAIKPELNAQITVEGRDNSSRPLISIGNGRYNNANLGLTIGTEYRLHIKTSTGKEYMSDYVKARKTPVIDSIGYEVELNGLRVQAHTHDATKQTRYYRWDFDETWEIHSPYPSNLIFDKTFLPYYIRARKYPDEDVSTCWKFGTSSTIILANSTRLEDDIIYKAPVQFIENGSEKLSVRYSILLRQYALDREAYNFYELMKKNTEDIGNIFSPQPSEIRGNIHNVSDSKEYVLGYVTVSTVEEQRKFIQVPWHYFMYCDVTKVPANNADSTLYYFGPGGSLIPFAYEEPPAKYLGSAPQCVDCTKRGGTTKKPSYW